MTKEERFKMDMIDEFEQMCKIVEKRGRIIVNKYNRMLKALEQEPRKGHWIGHREHCENLGVMPSGLGAYEWCSNCDCGIDVREWHRNHYNFCPNCGADMRAESEDKE